jgi:flavin reductase (DIM6/NTAB) family NADH-FMN oxidoreductase RutF
MPDTSDIVRLLDREVWLVSAAHQGRRGGLIATFVDQASIVPDMPRMLVGIAKQHHTWALIEASRAFTLHLLDETRIDWVWRFGLQSGHATDKFAGFPELTGAVAWMKCRVETSLDIGDRTLYLAQVLESRLEANTLPLTLKRLLQLAPPERLRMLRDAMVRDADIDAAAIRAWREEHNVSG